MAQTRWYFQKDSGVSLVEVVVVLVIFSLLAALATPSLEHFRQRQKVGETLRNIAALLLNSRFAALKANAAVVVDISSEGCHAFYDNGRGSHAWNWEQEEDEKNLADVTLEPGLTLTNTCNRRTHPDKFRYTGKVRVSPCSIVVKSAEKEEGKVVINAVGRVHIKVFE